MGYPWGKGVKGETPVSFKDDLNLSVDFRSSSPKERAVCTYLAPGRESNRAHATSLLPETLQCLVFSF